MHALRTIALRLAPLLAPALPAGAQAGPPPGLPIDVPLVVRGSTRVPPGEYLRPPLGPEGRRGVIVLEGLSDVTLDLRGVSLRGAPESLPRDRHDGWGIVLEGCTDVTLLGGELGGYRGCIVARDCHNLTIDGFTFDGYFAQRLRSTVAAEDQSDWLWPHENDSGEWLASYGGAIALTDCSSSIVRNCRARNGQNGLLLNRTGDCQVYDNDFSFLSGWGLAMFRSSKNVVSHNRFDYCVRGYSHGVYWRGQDSAGILMFERCSDNVIAYNSATHSGDGLFVYAGHDRVEGRALARGEKPAGGSDRNLIYRNDFSHAVANGVEITFSEDNRVIENVAVGCHQHGLWGGYSSRMVVVGNDFSRTRGGGVSIEHGQECVVAQNVLHECEIGVELWWDEDPQFVNGPYGKSFDTASRDHWVIGNSFAGNDSDLVAKRTTGLVLGENVFESDARELYFSDVRAAEEPGRGSDDDDDLARALRARLAGVGGWMPSGHVSRSTLRAWGGEEHPALRDARFLVAPHVPGKLQAFDPDPGKPGLESIVLGEWGPWDFESGAPRPAPRLPGGLLAGATWQAAWFSWREGPDPRGSGVALDDWRALAAAPLVRGEVGSWATPWGENENRRGRVGGDHFGLVATTRVELEPGRYRFSVLSDDGVRLSVDGKPVIENWTWHPPTRDEVVVDLAGGPHNLVLEYFQIDGAAALSVDLERVGDQGPETLSR